MRDYILALFGIAVSASLGGLGWVFGKVSKVDVLQTRIDDMQGSLNHLVQRVDAIYDHLLSRK